MNCSGIKKTNSQKPLSNFVTASQQHSKPISAVTGQKHSTYSTPYRLNSRRIDRLSFSSNAAGQCQPIPPAMTGTEPPDLPPSKKRYGFDEATFGGDGKIAKRHQLSLYFIGIIII